MGRRLENVRVEFASFDEVDACFELMKRAARGEQVELPDEEKCGMADWLVHEDRPPCDTTVVIGGHEIVGPRGPDYRADLQRVRDRMAEVGRLLLGET